MFLLFFNLYHAMFVGTWTNFTWNNFLFLNQGSFNIIGKFLSSLFNNVDTPMENLGDLFNLNSTGFPAIIPVISTILATITSIGIVVMAVKGVKRAFGIFFMGIR